MSRRAGWWKANSWTCWGQNLKMCPCMRYQWILHSRTFTQGLLFSGILLYCPPRTTTMLPLKVTMVEFGNSISLSDRQESRYSKGPGLPYCTKCLWENLYVNNSPHCLCSSLTAFPVVLLLNSECCYRRILLSKWRERQIFYHDDRHCR